MKNEILERFNFELRKNDRRITIPLKVVNHLLRENEKGEVIVTVYENKVVITGKK